MAGRRAALAIACALAVAAARAAPIPDIRLVRIASGFVQPVHLAQAPGAGRLYVVEQRGAIRVLQRGGTEHPLFLDVRDRVAAGGEMGLLSVAFHPDYAHNRRLFVDYTTRAGGGLRTRVSEFAAEPDLATADASSERILLDFAQPYANHNGGLVAFGPDGYLYVGNGDGGAANDPHNNGQRLDTWLGKLLRIDVDARGDQAPYAIPPDNPWVGQPGARPELFVRGLRNPWRFSFDRKTGELWCGDVGQNTREEVDLLARGGNFGWRIMEGFINTPQVNPVAAAEDLRAPVLDYPRSEGVSVTGGYVYRGARWPALQGVYLYGDFGSGHIWGLRHGQGRVLEHRKLVTRGPPVSSFGEDAEGELYVVGYDGAIYAVETK